MNAKEIRNRLKAELGLNSRQVSVRSSRGSAIHVTIKVPVAKSPIEAIAKGAECVRRCEFSGDILSGGNTFVFVEYEEGVLDGFFDENAIKALKEDPGKVLEMPGGFDIHYSDCGNHYCVSHKDDSFVPERAWSPQGAGRCYAQLFLNAQAKAA